MRFILSCLHSGAPQITVSAPTYAIQGGTLTVNCSVTSFPQSNMSLSLGDTPIMTSVPEDYDSTAGSFTYSTTHSTTAVYPSDEGNYTCSAIITHGQPAVTEVFSDTAFVAVYGGSCSYAHYSTGGSCAVAILMHMTVHTYVHFTVCAVTELDNTCSATHTGAYIAVCAMGNNNAHMICRGRHMVHTARALYITGLD